MKEFDHPHVMSLIGVCLDAGPGVSMVMPFMTNGSLLEYLKKERSNLLIEVEVDMDKVAICIARYFIHANPYLRKVHAQLKMGCILWSVLLHSTPISVWGHL